MIPQLVPDPKNPNQLTCVIPCGDGEIDIDVNTNWDGSSHAEVINAFEAAFPRIPEYDQKARAAAAKELLENYNRSWRFFSEQLEDGTYEDVEMPELTEEEFMAELVPNSFSVLGKTSLQFAYYDGGMFWHHWVIVHGKAPDFTDTHAQIDG